MKLVVLSRATQANVRTLASHYKSKNYIEAVRYLRAAVAQARLRIAADPSGGAAFPRPYRGTKIPGVLWIFEHRYWIAYRPEDMTITGVFYDGSDIPNRLNQV